MGIYPEIDVQRYKKKERYANISTFFNFIRCDFMTFKRVLDSPE